MLGRRLEDWLLMPCHQYQTVVGKYLKGKQRTPSMLKAGYNQASGLQRVLELSVLSQIEMIQVPRKAMRIRHFLPTDCSSDWIRDAGVGVVFMTSEQFQSPPSHPGGPKSASPALEPDSRAGQLWHGFLSSPLLAVRMCFSALQP